MNRINHKAHLTTAVDDTMYSLILLGFFRRGWGGGVEGNENLLFTCSVSQIRETILQAVLKAQ